MNKRHRIKREGKVVVLVALLMPALAGMGAFAIDVGYIELTRSQLQAGADAGALAAVEDLPTDQVALDFVAVHNATLNTPANGANVPNQVISILRP